MSLARDLLAQAQMLATREPKKPRQASLRRAISSAYYALFQLLVDAASRQLVSGLDNTRLRHRVARSFRHNEMKNTCKDVAQWRANNPPKRFAGLLDAQPTAEWVRVAEAFVELQQARHNADYNVETKFSRDDVVTLIRTADRAFEAFDALDKTGAERRIFLAALAFSERWQKN